MSVFQTKSLGQILLEAGKITQGQLKEAIAIHEITKQDMGTILINKKYVSDQTLYDAMKLLQGLDYTHLTDFKIPDELKVFSAKQLEEYKIIPIEKTWNTVKLGMVNPTNLSALDLIRGKFKNITVEPIVISEDDFEKIIREYKKSEFLQDTELAELLSRTIGPADANIELITDKDGNSEQDRSSSDAPIIQLADRILVAAVLKGVSDIHIQPQEKDLLLRYRLDGTLYTEQRLPNKIKAGLISRFKIMANLDIAEKRIPQDGRIRIRVKDKGDIDFRVSTLPSKFGEKVVMRILDKSNTILGLDKLFPFPKTLELIREMIDQPYGIIYVTGPTGSGKTTSLYAALSELNKPDWNIVTVEDPIEYDLPGITQVQVDNKAGRDFATVLRSFLRQDPDIILIGETRDKETALIGIEAALTGHMVFTTLHSNDAPGTIMRLKQIGIDPFLIASATIGVFAQRLLKRICQSCKTEYRPSQTIIDYFNLTETPESPLKFYHGKGCDKCNKTGYKGRIGVYEILKINEDLKDLIVRDTSTAKLRHVAIHSGMVTLQEYALQLVREGYTTIEEVRANVLTSDDTDETELFCPYCINPIEASFAACPYCLKKLKIHCKYCNMVLKKEWKGCPNCALPIEEIINKENNPDL